MKEGAGNSHSSSGPQGKTADVRLKRFRRRNQVEKRMKLQLNQTPTSPKNAPMCVPGPKPLQCQQEGSGERQKEREKKKKKREQLKG